MACCLPHNSAVSINISQERCDNFSVTLGRREWCLCRSRLTGRAQGSAVYVSNTATVSRHGWVKGQRGEMDDSGIYTRVCNWWRSILPKKLKLLWWCWQCLANCIIGLQKIVFLRKTAYLLLSPAWKEDSCKIIWWWNFMDCNSLSHIAMKQRRLLHFFFFFFRSAFDLNSQWTRLGKI